MASDKEPKFSMDDLKFSNQGDNNYIIILFKDSKAKIIGNVWKIDNKHWGINVKPKFRHSYPDNYYAKSNYGKGPVHLTRANLVYNVIFGNI